MIKCSIFAMMSLWVSATLAHDVSYYKLHPKVLQQALNACPKQTTSLDCEQLKKIASDTNILVYELRMDPQGYGQKILALQEKVAVLEAELTKTKSQEAQSVLKQNKQQLSERLAVVKWLESPES
jgi:hypothetical protein